MDFHQYINNFLDAYGCSNNNAFILESTIMANLDSCIENAK